MKKFWFILILFSFSVPGFSQWVNMKNLKVAVLDVVSRVSGEEVDAATLTEMLQVALVDRQEFKIVERSLLSKIIQEQEFQLSGLTDGQAAKVGALAGADKVMMVSVAKVEGRYIFIVKAVDSASGIVDLTDQVMSFTVGGMIDLFPIMADRIIRKARGERIPPYQMAPGQPKADLPGDQGIRGLYQAVGTNPDGSTYRGVCEITPESDGTYRFQWTIGSGSYTGKGTLSSGVMTVIWESPYPVIYKVLQGGKVLEGLWEDGEGTEVLRR